MEPEIKALINAHAPYLRALDDGKVECILNGHAFAPRKYVIEAFLNGKKFQKLKKRHDAELDLEKYKPFLSDSLNFPGMLFCSLTNQLIAKDKGKIEAHVSGRRYQGSQARHEAGEMELWVEPTPEDLEAMEAEMVEELADLENLERMEAAAAAARGEGVDGDGDEEMEEDDGNHVDAFLKEIGALSDSEEEEEGEEEEEKKPAPKKKAAKAAAGGGKKGKAAKPAPKEAKKTVGKKQPARGAAANGKPAKKARK